MNQKIRWGLMGAGGIINRWIRGAKQVGDMEIVAVASRTRESAQKMADQWDIPRVMTYEEMACSDDIDIVYIPVPHPGHRDLAIQAMNHGKHVLVEKPAAMNAREFKEMMACAKENGVFLMEAMWMRFFPILKEARDLIRQGVIGDVRCVQADFCFRADETYPPRLTEYAQGGGSLLDTGVYVLHFAHMIYGKYPEKLTGFASIDTDDWHLQVDEQTALIGQYDHGELAVLQSAIRTDMPQSGRVYGTRGSMTFPVFWKPTRVEIQTGDQLQVLEEPIPDNGSHLEDEGYQYEVAFVNDCLRKGIVDPEEFPQEVTLRILEQMDQLRASWGLVYDADK